MSSTVEFAEQSFLGFQLKWVARCNPERSKSVCWANRAVNRWTTSPRPRLEISDVTTYFMHWSNYARHFTFTNPGPLKFSAVPLCTGIEPSANRMLSAPYKPFRNRITFIESILCLFWSNKILFVLIFHWANWQNKIWWIHSFSVVRTHTITALHVWKEFTLEKIQLVR